MMSYNSVIKQPSGGLSVRNWMCVKFHYFLDRINKRFQKIVERIDQKLDSHKFYHYSGLKFIWRKFYPKDDKILPTGFVWLVALYAAVFGLTSQVYENRVDIIENRTNILISSLLNKYIGNTATGQIALIQNSSVPVNPKFWNPLSVLASLVGLESSYPESIKRLQESLQLIKHDLKGVMLISANLGGANLEDAKLSGAILGHANLEGANLEHANLAQAFLYGANLTRASLYGTNLNSADLYVANLSEANLREAKLKEANLNEANLTKADLYKADLYKANLKDATLFGANLNRAKNLTCKQIKLAKIDQQTKFPDYIKVKDGKKFTCEMVQKKELKKT